MSPAHGCPQRWGAGSHPRPRRAAPALAVAAAGLLATTALALPDLQPELYDVHLVPDQTVGTGDVAEGCAAATEGRLLLRFGIRFYNLGPDALVIGDPRCPDCATSPGTVCVDSRFLCSPADGHDHPHLIGFARYQLLDVRGNTIREGGKKSFCVRDNSCPDGTPTFDCSNMGISPGCVDDYDPSLGCQYIDVTGVADARRRAFRLRATLDPDHHLPDGDRANNVVEVLIPGCGDGVVQALEDCDPAATPADPCCGADCRLAPPGSPCEPPPPGPCGPPDAPRPDGSSCGPGSPPCLAEMCASGVCETERLTGGCVIGATCLLPGALDPGDPCQRCDPASRADGWTRNEDADPAGLRCEAARLTRALAGTSCRPSVETRLDRRLLRLHRLLDRVGGTSAVIGPGLERRIGRTLRRLGRSAERARRTGCDVGTFPQELQVLQRQFDAYRASR
jgi:hypothetical protein